MNAALAAVLFPEEDRRSDRFGVKGGMPQRVARPAARGVPRPQTFADIVRPMHAWWRAWRDRRRPEEDSEVDRDEDDYRNARLVFEQTQAQVTGILEATQVRATTAQQILLVDAAVLSILAAAAIGIEQIRLQLKQLYGSQMPLNDTTLVLAGLWGLLTLAVFVLASAIAAVWCFTGRSAKDEELGPTAQDLAREATGLSAVEMVLLTAVLWQRQFGPAILRFRPVALKLRVAVNFLVLSVPAACLVAAFCWYAQVR